jgi:hypothetical protein
MDHCGTFSASLRAGLLERCEPMDDPQATSACLIPLTLAK